MPIPKPSAAQSAAVESHVETIVDLTREVSDASAAVLDVLRMEWDVGTPGQALAELATLSSDDFVREVKKRRAKGSPRLSPPALAELRKLFDAEAPPLVAKRARILGLEREIAAAVHAAYGLDAADLALLRETAPPRMPPGW